MGKFKVGDKVKVVQLINSNTLDVSSGIRVGDMFTVTAIDPEDAHYILIDYKDMAWIDGVRGYPMRDFQLELVKEDNVNKFKVGDKVKVVKYCEIFSPDVMVGDEATVLSVYGKEARLELDFGGLHQFIHSSHHPGVLELVSNGNKSKLMLVYKVVDKNYKSCIVSANGWETHYEIGEQVKPEHKGSYLYAFDSLCNAKRFQLYQLDSRILKCVARVVQDKPDACGRSSDKLDQFWAQPNPRGNSAPDGSVWCKWVFPIEEVE